MSIWACSSVQEVSPECLLCAYHHTLVSKLEMQDPFHLINKHTVSAYGFRFHTLRTVQDVWNVTFSLTSLILKPIYNP